MMTQTLIIKNIKKIFIMKTLSVDSIDGFSMLFNLKKFKTINFLMKIFFFI